MASAPPTYYTDDPARWGTPFKWVEPEYPKTLLAQKITGRVDVLVNVSAEGRMQEIVALRAEPAQLAFEESVREVMRQWKFARAMDDGCKPIPVQSRLQIRFDIQGDQPKVSLAGGPVTSTAALARMFELNRSEVQEVIWENFPRDAARAGRTGDVNALLKVDPKTGETLDVDVVDVQTDKSSYNTDVRRDGPSRNVVQASPVSIQFAAVTREALAKLKFTPLPDAGSAPVSVCREVFFQVRGVRRK